MNKKILLLAASLCLFNIFVSNSAKAQVVLPDVISGLKEYKSAYTCDGYTLISPLTANAYNNQKIKLIDMTGKVVKTFNILGMPAKMFPGGYVLGRDGYEGIDLTDSKRIEEVDWNGHILWSFDKWWQDDDGTWYSR